MLAFILQSHLVKQNIRLLLEKKISSGMLVSLVIRKNKLLSSTLMMTAASDAERERLMGLMTDTSLQPRG